MTGVGLKDPKLACCQGSQSRAALTAARGLLLTALYGLKKLS